MNETTSDAVAESRLKRFVMFLWDGLGKPDAWLLAMIVVFISEMVGGVSVFGAFWMAVCALVFFLARMAIALETMAKARTEKIKGEAMHVETAITAIEEWYDGECFQIGPITTEPKGSVDDFDQSATFLSVVGYQNQVGMDGDSFEGAIYFEFEPGKFISTRFWC